MIKDLIGYIKQFLPSHLWIDKSQYLYHIDGYNDDHIFDPDAKIPSIICPQAIGHIANIDTYDLYAQIDALHMIIPFYDFLQDIGGDSTRYKEVLKLTTGQNPWSDYDHK